MPIFEFMCEECHRTFSVLVGVVSNSREPVCPKCGGKKLTKLISRFSRLRSEEDKLESLADESLLGDVENDPKAMRKWVREMGKAMDEDMGDDLEAALEEEMSGASPESGSDGAGAGGDADMAE